MVTLAPSPIRKLRSIFYGWRVVAASFLLNAVNDGTWLFGFTVLFLPISRDLNLSRTAISIPFALNRALMTIFGPFLGYMIDRFGPSAILLWSGLLAGIGFMMLKWTNSYIAFVLVMVGMINIGMMPLIPAGTAAVVPWFARRRSLAMGVCNAGWPVGTAVLPPLLGIGVDLLGWRNTAFIIGVGVWLTVIPLSRIFTKTPRSLGVRPDGVPQPPAPSQAGGLQPPAQTQAGPLQRPAQPEAKPARDAGRSAAPSPDMTVREALRCPRLWILALAMGFHSMTITAISVHFVPIMVWKGLPEENARYLVGIWAIYMAPTLLMLGWFGDKWFKSKVSSLGLFVRAFGWLIFILWMDGEFWKMLVILLLLSPDFGVFSVIMALVADWVGIRHYATIRSAIFTVSGLLGFGAPVYAGWIFDRTDSYMLFAWPSFALSILAASILWFLPTSGIGGRPGKPTEET